MSAARTRATGRYICSECPRLPAPPTEPLVEESSSAPRISKPKPINDHMALDCRASQPPPTACVPATGYDEAARRRPGVPPTEGGDMLMMQGSAMTMDVPLLWNDEGRMKRELVAWAKAVASMAIRESMRC
uniref:Uncharacterized protein n=1 Tax=Avena sativa TaxID=4498 RepID=A0ACD5UAU9_AVESA